MSSYNTKPGVDWNVIKADFDAGHTLHECVRLQCARGVPITKRAIQKRRDKEGWNTKAAAYNAATRLPSVIAQATGLATTEIRTAERAAAILELFQRGLPQKTVARLAGIAESTLIDWRSADPELDAQCDAATEQWHSGMIAHVDAAAPRDWKAAQWRLQTHSKTKGDYAQQGHGGPNIQVVVNVERAAPETITINGTAEKL